MKNSQESAGILPPKASLTVDTSEEPPLDEEALDIAVPDFLSEDQQALYRRSLQPVHAPVWWRNL